ncbi:hypothetical protein [Streptomyces sp. KLOTTS4A1]|uniref:hypothetical protein n=1 Tax=Streptomyces sp. KLOTTS4A1 TaxID=3390996 RepID=UPI0039F45DC2
MMSVVGRLLAALLRLAAVAATVIGVPVLLVALGRGLGASPLPDSVPSVGEVVDALLAPDDGGRLLSGVLLALAWGLWLWLAIPLLVEVGAVVLRRSTPRLPGMRTGQRLAGYLLGGLLLASPAAAAAAATPAHAVTLSLEDPTGTAAAATAAPSASTAARPSVPAQVSVGEYTHQVREAGVLAYDVAEARLGDGLRWKDLADLNPELHVTGAASELPVGGVLRLPADAAPPQDSDGRAEHASMSSSAAPMSVQAPASADGDAARDSAAERVVEPGDSLSLIAEDETGDPNAWPELYAENKGQAQPHGRTFTDPDLIYPGQKLMLPDEWSAPSEGSTPSDRGEDPDKNREGAERAQPPAQLPEEDSAESDGPSSTPDSSESPQPDDDKDSGRLDPAESPDASKGPSQSAEVPAQPSRNPSPSHSPTAVPGEPSESEDAGAPVPPPASSSGPSASTSPTHSRSPSAPPASSHQAVDLRLVAGAGLLLATGITAALATRRALQRRRRGLGERIAVAEEPSAAEAQLAAAADEAPAQQLDRALRTLAAAADGQGAVLPPVAAARITPRSVEVLPVDRTVQPMTPFTAGGDGWWVLPDEAHLLSPEDAGAVAAPYPGLVTLGSDSSGDLVLLNLPQTQVVLLDGEDEDIEAVLTALALELAEAPWAQQAELICVGFGTELQGLLPSSRLAYVREPAHAVRDLAERLLSARQFPEEAHQPYVLCAKSLDPDSSWLLAEALQNAGDVPVALVAPSGGVTQLFPEAHVLDASADGAQHVDAVDLPVRLQRLDRSAYQQIVTAFQVASQPAEPAQGMWRNVPGESSTVEEAAEGGGQPLVAAVARPVVRVSAGSSPTTAERSSVPVAFQTASSEPGGLRLISSLSPVPSPAAGGREPGEDEHGPGGEQPTTTPVEPDAEAAGGAAAVLEVEELHVPEIRVLGPVDVTELASSGQGPRLAQLAALLYFKADRDGDTVCADMSPNNPWSRDTLTARMKDLRTRLGTDADGEPYVPRRTARDTPFRISPRLRCDWTRFQQLAEQGLDAGPSGLAALEKALQLVRGRPFGEHPLPWCDPLRQEMTVRIVDVAHTVAAWRMAPGPARDLAAARQAVTVGLTADEVSEVLFRDWMRIEHELGNRSGLHTAITRMQTMIRTLHGVLEPETEELIDELMGRTGRINQSQ